MGALFGRTQADSTKYVAFDRVRNTCASVRECLRARKRLYAGVESVQACASVRERARACASAYDRERRCARADQQVRAYACAAGRAQGSSPAMALLTCAERRAPTAKRPQTPAQCRPAWRNHTENSRGRTQS
eukprot:6179371-Pleurochrysis_carterae.AAC.3